MTTMVDRLRACDAEEMESEFDAFEEEVIVSLAMDNPDYFVSIHHLLEPTLFALPHVQYIVNELIDCAQKWQTVPQRMAFTKLIKSTLGIDSDYWLEIKNLLERPASYRDLPMVKDKLDGWVKRRQISKLYSKEGSDAFQRGDFEKLIDIVEGVTKFNQESYKCFDLMDDMDQLFLPDNSVHMTTGFKMLDKCLNNGGPSPGEVVLYMGPTNVGKSIFLCNTAVSHFQAGYDTLLITFELDTFKTARRCLAPLTNIPIDNLDAHQSKLRSNVQKIHATHGNRLLVLEWPPDEVSVDQVYAALQNLQRGKGFRPQSIILDYMDLMVGRRDSDNKDDYTRQKYVAYQLRGLAKKTGCLVTTATQTNRAGNDQSSGPIDLTKTAESYGKTMPLDYVITLNQSAEEHAAGKVGLWIAKNRNGAKNQMIRCDISYSILSTRESTA